jgi:hypothetical protein
MSWTASDYFGWQISLGKDSVKGRYVRHGQLQDAGPEDYLPATKYLIIGAFDDYLIFAASLGEGVPSTKHRYLVRMEDWHESRLTSMVSDL